MAKKKEKIWKTKIEIKNKITYGRLPVTLPMAVKIKP